MPDYDPKSIPILDDVIENIDSEKNNLSISDDKTKPHDAETETTENNLELFSAEAIDLITGDPVTEDSTTETEPQIGAINTIDNEDSSELSIYTLEDVSKDTTEDTYSNKSEETTEDEPESIESALIDYRADKNVDEPALDTVAINNQADDPELSIEVGGQTSATPISLQAVTDDIVKQLMPVLEQQLRFLLKRALKKKLSKKTTRPGLSSDIDN